MLLTRRKIMAGCAGAAITLAASDAGSHLSYPTKRMTLVVPFPPGAATDVLGRLVAEQFKTGMDATVIVENKPGAGSIVGATHVAKAEPDGYTLLMATSTTLAINKALYSALPYDPVADFTPVSLVAAVPFVLVVNSSLPVNSLSEFIAYVKSRPGEISYGSAGNGSPHHLGGAMLNVAAGFEMKHIPYKGSAPAMQDVIAGHIPLMVVDLQPSLPHIRAGQLRAIGVTTPTRVQAAPEIPTLGEGGLTDFELVAWQGLVGPRGLPRPIVDRLAREIAALTSAEDMRKRLVALALEPLDSTPETFARFIKAEISRWAPIVKASGASVG